MSKKRKVKTSMKIFLSVIFIILLTLSSSFSLLYGLNSTSLHTISYNEDSDVDYKICFTENNYFFDKCISKDNQYIASLIEYMDAKFLYSFDVSNEIDYEYKYRITVDIVAKEKNDSNKIVHQKEETILKEKKYKKTSSKSFIINEEIRVDYKKYNDFMSNFKKDYELELDSVLIVTMYIDIDGVYKEIRKPLHIKQELKITIPLSEQTVDIKANYKKVEDSNTIEDISRLEIKNIIFYSVAGALLVIDLIYVVRFVRLLKKLKKPKTEYEKTLNKILKEYNQLIVESNRIPKLDEFNIVEVVSFDELIDAKNIMGRPILHIETRTGKKSWFIIFAGNEVYRYVLNAGDLKAKR